MFLSSFVSWKEYTFHVNKQDVLLVFGHKIIRVTVSILRHTPPPPGM